MTSTEVAAESSADERPTLFQGKLLFWAPIVPLVIADLWSKSAAFAYVAAAYPHFPENARRVEVLDWNAVGFDLVQWTNPGTVWGLFHDFNHTLTILRIIAVPLLVYFAYRTVVRQRLQLLVLGLIISGAIGNLWDNLTQRDGAVRDFLLFYARWGGSKHEFPAFNIADSCITVGAITLAVLLWRQPTEKAEPR